MSVRSPRASTRAFRACAKSKRDERAPRCSPHVLLLRDGEAAPRGRDSGRERVVDVVSFNGRPGTRQGSRTPHLGAVLPVDAYSLAVTCGGRGVSLDIWPASHSAPAAPRAVRLPGHDRDRSPSRTTRRATTWFPPRRLSPAGAGSLPRLGGLPGRQLYASPPRATTRLAYRCLCDASTAYAAALQRGTGAASLCRFHTPGSSSRQRRPWRPVCAGHLSTASSRGHQQSSQQSPWRDWPQGRIGAPSLPDCRVFRRDAAPRVRRSATGPVRQ